MLAGGDWMGSVSAATDAAAAPSLDRPRSTPRQRGWGLIEWDAGVLCVAPPRSRRRPYLACVGSLAYKADAFAESHGLGHAPACIRIRGHPTCVWGRSRGRRGRIQVESDVIGSMRLGVVGWN